MKSTEVVLKALRHLSVETDPLRLATAGKQIREWAGQAEKDAEKRRLLEALDVATGQMPPEEFWSDVRNIIAQCLNELPAPT